MSDLNKNNADNNTPLGGGAASPSLIYNITTQVLWGVHEMWLAWMLDDHIPQILGTGCFVKHQVVRLMEADETEGPVYAVQYYLQDKSQYDTYLALYQPAFKQQEYNKWGEKIFSFSSLMQVVH